MRRMIKFIIIALFSFFSTSSSAQELRVFFGSLHSHTSFSDGRGTPHEAYTHARDAAGLDFMAITEHNHPRAGQIANNPGLYNGNAPTSLRSAAQFFTEQGRFVAIYGQEFSTISSGNHANVFEVREVIAASDVANGSWDDLLNTWIPGNLDEQNLPALILLNHPATSGSPNNREYGRDDFGSFDDWRTALDVHAQLINIINGPSHDNPRPGAPSESEYRRYLNFGFHLGPTADQDNHRRNWGSAADTRTGVIASELSKTAIMAALRSRHVYASEDRNLSVIARIGGHLIGTRVTGNAVPQTDAALPIAVAINDPDEPLVSYEVEVFSDHVGGGEDADIIHTETVSGNGTFNISGVSYAGGHQYLFLKITQRHDDVPEGDRVWTAPVWFEGSSSGPPSPGTGEPNLSLAVDLRRETARVINDGADSVDLAGWTLTSVRGNQVFTFPSGTVIGPGQTMTVVSGPRAANASDNELDWPGNQHIWRNAGDPGELRDEAQNVIATDP